MTALLDAIEALIKPTKTPVSQWYVGRGPVCTVKCPKSRGHSHTVMVEHEPLLVQLEAAIASTMGVGAGRSAEWTRNVLDGDALHRFVMIDHTIREWCTALKVPTRGRSASQRLEGWYAARLAATQTSEGWYIAKLTSWAVMITEKLDPPVVMEFTDPCPVCKESHYWDESGFLQPKPVRISYMRESANFWKDATAQCRSCGHEWQGEIAMKILASDQTEPTGSAT